MPVQAMCDNQWLKNSSDCGPHCLKDVTSNRQFAIDYAEAIGRYAMDFEYPKEVHRPPKPETVLSLAEKEYLKVFGKAATHAVYAPARINLCGEPTDFNDGKVLSMATQLVVVIVGARRTRSRLCKVKTLLREVGEIDYHEFFTTRRGLNTSGDKTWINYVKSVVSCFAVGREQIPGFRALIVSSIPIKCGLGSSSALTVAMYTFLEAITNVYMWSIFEKSLACQWAEKNASPKVPCSFENAFFSLIGNEGRVTEFDPKTLQVKEHRWKPFEIDLLLINSARIPIDATVYQKWLNPCREVAFALHLTSLRDATLPELVKVEKLFSPTVMERARHVVSESNRVVEAVELIERCQWRKLGITMWKSHCSTRDNFRSSCVEIERITETIRNIRGVYGARIVGRGSGGLILVLVKREAVKDMVNALSRHIAECQDYRVIQPSYGAGIFYTDGKDEACLHVPTNRFFNKSTEHRQTIDDFTSYKYHRDTIYQARRDRKII